MVCKSRTLQVSPLQFIVIISRLDIVLGSSVCSGPGLFSIPAIIRAILISLRVGTLVIGVHNITVGKRTNLSDAAPVIDEHLGVKELKGDEFAS